MTNIARNPLLRLVVECGRRSMGDQLRFDPTQPRELTDTDLRADDKLKVVTNDPTRRVSQNGQSSHAANGFELGC